MSTLIIVGAGATLAEATPSQPPVSRTPPLDSTFFRLCKAAKLTGLGTVRNYMRRYYDIDPTSNDYRMEEIFNFIYSDAFSPTSPDDCLDAYSSLIKMYGAALARTTNELQGSSRSGVGALLRKMWLHERGRAITFLTFNQDLVIENAIEHTKSKQRYSDIPWNIRSAYHMGFSRYREVRGGAPFSSSRSEPSLAVLKLHGSMNWVYRVLSHRDVKNSIRSPSQKLVCVNERGISSVGFREQRQSGRSWTFLPLVVPPIYEKASRYTEPVKKVWFEALQAIRKATGLIVFGYSFPDTDFAARSLFRRGFHENKTLNHVNVIDPDPIVSAKVSDFVGARATHHYVDLEAWEADH